MTEAYAAIKDECRKLRLNARRVDESPGSGFVIREVTDLIKRVPSPLSAISLTKDPTYTMIWATRLASAAKAWTFC